MQPKSEYLDLRKLAFETPRMGDPPEDEREFGIYVFINENQRRSRIYTIRSFICGDASVYISEEGGYLGGIGVPDVSSVGRDTLPALEKIAQFMQRTDSIDLPEEGNGVFCLLTRRGRLRRSARNIEQNAKSLDFSLHLFGQALITRMHQAKMATVGKLTPIQPEVQAK